MVNIEKTPNATYIESDDLNLVEYRKEGNLGVIELTNNRKMNTYSHAFFQQMDKAILEARYDEFVRYCDYQFRNFILELEKRNVLDNTIIILTADHGESFDHNYLLHGGYHLYQEIVNIPLIIKLPENKGGRIINDVTEQIDITATLADLADIPVPAWMEGESLIPLMNGEISTSGPAFSMSFERNPGRGNKIEKGAVAVTEEQYKLIHYLERDESLLFNLDNDPEERDNLIDEELEIGSHLLKVIKDSLKKANERIIKQW